MSNMVVQTNVLALNSHRYMKQVGQAQSKSSARLSSGYKINSAADDAAGLAISEKMRAQIRGLDQASKNAQDGISLIQTAEGGMQEIDNMLQRIRELVVSVSNDTNENNTVGTGDRQKMQDEIDQLVAEIDSMSERVEFNKKKVINGSYADTALQLKNAKAEYDRSSLGKVETNAKLSAYKDALGVADDASSATGTTAYSRLNATQDAVDAGVDPYKDALKAYTAAEVVYTEARDAYQTTKNSMEALLTKNNLEAKAVTNDMLDSTKAAYKGDDFKRAFTAYQEASNTWGIEELGFSQITNANKATSKAFTGVASADLVDVAGTKSAVATFNKAVEDAKANPSIAAFIDAGGIEAKMAYDTASGNLSAVLSAKGIAANAITGKDITDNNDLAAALEAYVKAADAYGIDDVDTTGVSAAPYMTENGLPVSFVTMTVDTSPATGSFADKLANFEGETTAANQAAYLDALIVYKEADPTGAIKKAYDDAVVEYGLAKTATVGLNFTTITAATDDTDRLAAALSAYISAAEAYGLDGIGTGLASETFGSTTETFANTVAKLNALTGKTETVSPTTLNAAKAPTTALAGSVAAKYAAATSAATTAPAKIPDDLNKLTDEMIGAYKEYKDARNAFSASIVQVLGAGKTEADLTNANVAENKTLYDALSRYASAATAWGLDELDVITDAANLDPDEVTIDNKYKPVANASPVPTASIYNSLSVADKATVDGLITQKETIVAKGAYAVFQAEKSVFEEAEAKYNDLVAKRDTAQNTVNKLTTNVENTEKEKLRTDILYNVANSKLDTAKNAVEDDNSQALYFQVGANATQGLEMSIGSVKSDVLGIGDGKGVTNIDVVKDTGLDTTALLDVLDTALSYVTTERSRLGAAQNRLEYTIKSLDISSENLSAAESRIRDTDMAKEMMELTKANTLQQASISMLAQANQAPQSVLQLLG